MSIQVNVLVIKIILPQNPFFILHPCLVSCREENRVENRGENHEENHEENAECTSDRSSEDGSWEPLVINSSSKSE